MSEEEHTGGRRRAVEPEDAREVLENADEPVLSTSEVGDRLGVSHPTAGKRLNTLQERGEVDYADVGRSKAWYLSEVTEHRLSEYTDGDGPGGGTEEDEEVEETQTPPGYDEGSATLSQLSLGLMLFVPVLLAVGAVGTATLATVVGVGYAFLWAVGYDGRVAHHLTRAKREYDAVGGLRGFVGRLFAPADENDPDTLVERAARLDTYALSLVIVAAVFSSPVWGSYWLGTAGFGTWEPVIEFLGAGSAFSILSAAMIITMIAFLLAGVSAIASLALTSAGADETIAEARSLFTR
jgi:hypothetical protein